VSVRMWPEAFSVDQMTASNPCCRNRSPCSPAANTKPRYSTRAEFSGEFVEELAAHRRVCRWHPVRPGSIWRWDVRAQQREVSRNLSAGVRSWPFHRFGRSC
jgi:hypothetical protein